VCFDLEEYVIAKNINKCITNKHILFKRLDEYTHSLDCIHLHEADAGGTSITDWYAAPYLI